MTNKSMTINFTIITFMSILLSACQSSSNFFWYKPGVAPSSPGSDEIDCRVQAVKIVPNNTQVGQNPTYTVPATTNCFDLGTSITCTQSGGQVYGGDTYSYDANAGLRNDVKNQCMANKGYTSISLRSCSSSEDMRNGIPSYTLLPRLNANACAYQMQNGLFMFVNP